MIGIFDSGIGGLTVAKEIIEQLPYQIIYLGDNARIPYGTKSKTTVLKYSIENTKFLLNQGAKLIVIACHTASSLAEEELKRKFKIPIFGVLKPGIEEALRTTVNKKIGIIGTSSTISSKAHQKLIKTLNPEIEVFSVACPLFVPLVEENWEKRPETKKIARYYLKTLKRKQIDTLILACTHYPILSSVISEVMGKKVKLVDPAKIIPLTLKQFLSNHPEIESSLKKGDSHKFYFSDYPPKIPFAFQKLLSKNYKSLWKKD